MHELKSIIKPYVPFYEALRDGIVVTDLHGSIVYANPSTETFLNQSRKDLLNQKCCDVFDQESEFQDFLMELGVRKKIFKSVECTIDKTIKKLHICSSTVFSENTIPAGVLFIFFHSVPNATPIDDLEKDGSILHALNYHTDEVVIIGEVHNGKNIFCSNAINEMMGWQTHDYIIGGWAFVVSLTHPDDILQVADIYRNGLKLRSQEKFVHDHLPMIFVYRKRHRDGSWRWIRSQVFVMERGADSEVSTTITFLRDITIEKIYGVSLEDDIVKSKAVDGLTTLWSGARSSGAGQSMITTREKQILELVRDGLSTKAIANSLGLSVASINSFRKKLMEKLAAKNTAELVRRSYELKLFE